MMLFAKSSTTKVETMCGDFCLSFTWHRSNQIHARQKESLVQAAFKEICFDLCSHELCWSADSLRCSHCWL